MKQKFDVMIVGKSYSLMTMCKASTMLSRLYVLSNYANPGIIRDADDYEIEDTTNPDKVAAYARRVKPDFAIIASEDPLAAGVVDALRKIGVPCIGPTQHLARLESSKSFTRNLLAKYGIPGNPIYRRFQDDNGLSEFVHELGDFVVKPDGLTGGKGVRVMGDHFTTIDKGLAYCQELFAQGGSLVIEEKLDGEEFSLQSFFDGRHIAHMVPIQDHKRAYEDDTGPNTGGMGSYSCADHLLPFLRAEELKAAEDINRRVGEALLEETGEEYKGILYGGFMLTRGGLRVIEYNARFGDPEIMNIASLLDTDFIEICLAIINGTLDRLPVQFRHQASVCKYIVPKGYPNKLPKGMDTRIDIQAALTTPDYGNRLRVYYSAINEEDGAITLTDSRSLAFVGVADTLAEAERIAETAASAVKGNVFHRKDIGTPQLIRKRIEHMQRLFRMTSERKFA